MKTTVDTRVFETVEEFRQWRSQLPARPEEQPLLGFVPTMGALHEGHLSLIRLAARQCQKVVVSIFVNPLQFAPNEDFDKYPRLFEQDLELCRQAGVHAVFHPAVGELYPAGLAETTRVVPPAALISGLCGKFRPGHFEGVTTVVMKLFALVQPTRAYFGEKDYQQLVVIKRIVADLNLPLSVIGVPTVREADGLALSSRNAYLDPEQRACAPRLQQILSQVRQEALSGKKSLGQILAEGAKAIEEIAGASLQYLECVDAETLQPLSSARTPMVILVAARIGNVRLIDNLIVRQ